jgi:hypothetical protein
VTEEARTLALLAVAGLIDMARDQGDLQRGGRTVRPHRVGVDLELIRVPAKLEPLADDVLTADLLLRRTGLAGDVHGDAHRDGLLAAAGE